MADLKISALNSLAGADLVAADVVAVVDDSASETKKLTVSDLIANGTTLISDATIPSAKILFSAGSVATASVADAGITTAKVADSSITAAKLADNSSVTLVSTLPASGDFTGQIALDTDDDKIYIWDGSAWDSVKGAGSINVVNGSTTGEINIVTSTSGDTVTVSATLDDTTAAAQFLAGPTGAGGTVGYRAIIGTDLPTASTTAKGGVIVNGNGLTMSSDTIAIDNTVTAETEENHIVQYDANGLITGGRAIIAADVPNATSTAAGIIKPGSGLGVTGAGELNHNNSVTAGTASKVTFDAQGHITGTESLVAADIPDLDADKITTGSVPTARIAADAVTAEKLADRSTATIAETTPAGGAFIGQTHLNSITGDYFLWDGNVWQPIGISVGEIILAGTYDASTNLMATVTSEGTALSFVVGSALPAASSANKGYYVVVSEAGTGTSPAPTVALNPPDFLLSTGTAYTEIDVSSTVTAQQASNVAFTAAGNIAATNVQAAIEELDTEKVAAASPSLTGTVSIGTGGTIQFEGATANDFESTLTVVDPTADRTLSLPDATGTLVSTGDTGTVTSTMITDGTIVNADINASAEIAVSKLANGTARQLLQTDVAGSGVEFTSNVDVPGTLDVTGAATLDSTLAVTGATTVTGVINADGKVKFPAGTASAPSFYSGTDTNTGLYFSAADEISVATGGTQRVVVDSSGNVLINTTTLPTSDSKLTLENSGSSCEFNVISSASGGSVVNLGDTDDYNDGRIKYDNSSRSMQFQTANAEQVRIDSSGNVGIGTSSPGRNLVVNGGSSEGVLQITNNTSGTGVANGLEILCFTTGEVQFLNRENADMRFDTNNTERMRISSSGDVTVGPINTSSSTGYGAQVDMAANAATIKAQCQQTASQFTLLYEAYQGTNRNFYVSAAGAAYFQGSVGIGTSSPGSYDSSANNLVVGSASGDEGITIAAGTSSSSSINFADGTSGSAAYTGRILYQHSANALTLHTNGGIERMRILSNGHVVIGDNTDTGFFRVTAADGASDDQYVGQFENLEATAGRSYGVNIRAGSNSTDHGFRVKNRANDTTQFLVRGDGNVGIGTTSPERALVVSDAGAEGFEFFPGSSDTANTLNHYDRGSSSFIDIINQADKHIFGRADGEKMRLDGSGRLLIGTTSAGSNGTADDLVVANNGSASDQAGITIRGGTSGRSQIFFSDGTSGDAEYRGMLRYDHSEDSMQFRTSSAERMRIDSSGKVGINTTSPDQFLDIESSSTTTARVTAHGYICRNNWGSVSSLGNGMVSPSSNTLAFATNSTERLRIDSSGRLLVGRTSSTGSGEDIQDSKGGIRAIPQNSKTAAYTLVVGDVGKHINITTGGVTVPSGVFSTGDAVTIYNDSSSDQTVTQGSSVTLRSAGTADTGNRTLAQRGICTLLCVASNEFVISGAGLS